MNENFECEVYEMIETRHGVPLEDILWKEDSKDYTEYDYDDSNDHIEYDYDQGPDIDEPCDWDHPQTWEFDG